jgi:hypothetical protein
MSYPKNTAYSRITKISLGILAAGSALAVASAVIPSTGAWFFEGKTGKVIASTAKMGFTITDNDGMTVNGPLELRFDGLAPSVPVTQSFTVTNTGDLPGRLDVDLSKLTATVGDPDFSKLTFAVDGGDAFVLPGNSSRNLSVGTLQPGQQKIVTIILALDDNASTEWQNVTITNQLDIGLYQIR